MPITASSRRLHDLATRFVDLVLTPRCMACDAYLPRNARPYDACHLCQATVFPIDGPRCPLCSLPREPVVGRHVRGADDLCHDCASGERHFSRIEACWEYDGAIADALRRAKYGRDLASLRALARQAAPWWEDALSRLTPSPGEWRWTSVPPHPADLRRRGFDSPALLTRWLGPDLPWERPLLRRHPREARAGLDRVARRQHARRAYRFREGADATGRWVVVDDVVTTGATMDAVARSLRRAGADEVVGLVLARTT